MRSQQEDLQAKTTIQKNAKKTAIIKDKSLIVVHTGDGKGKTTAAMGMVLRAVMHQWKVAVVQFMKNPDEFKYGEQKFAKQFENIDLFMMGAGFTWDTNNRDLDIQTTQTTWEKSKELIFSGKYKMILLDEINYVIDYDFLKEQEVLDVLNKKPPHTYLILTGRNATANIIQKADLVTEMKNIKHPYDEKGLLAQEGIEW